MIVRTVCFRPRRLTCLSILVTLVLFVTMVIIVNLPSDKPSTSSLSSLRFRLKSSAINETSHEINKDVEIHKLKRNPDFKFNPSLRRVHDRERTLQSRNKGTTTECTEPQTLIVYIKTHKTASSTVASIFQRFGYLRNLLFALPKTAHSFPDARIFPRRSLMPVPKGMSRTKLHFEMLTDHVRYDRKSLDSIIPNAKYITVLRDPVTQLESAFGYFEMAKGMGIADRTNPFETFMQRPEYFYRAKDYNMKNRSRNGLLYDLGFEPDQFDNASAVRKIIDTIDQEFHIILITEYLDESLILMKKVLCWNFNDILYIPMGIRSQTHRFPVSWELRDKIRIWNKADVLLYKHFNKTLWTNIRNYDGNFNADLQKFRSLKRQAMDLCIDNRTIDTRDRRENKYVINYRHGGDMCRNLLRRAEDYTMLFQRIRRLGNRLGSSSKNISHRLRKIF